MGTGVVAMSHVEKVIISLCSTYLNANNLYLYNDYDLRNLSFKKSDSLFFHFSCHADNSTMFPLIGEFLPLVF